MIKIKDGWRAWEHGPCEIGVKATGWFQRQHQGGKLELEVSLAQWQWWGIIPTLKRNTLEAVVDTGTSHTVISRVRFETCGFRLPPRPATNLRVSGVVRKSKTEVEKDEWLWGWPDVPMCGHLLDRLYGAELALPTFNLKVMVANNVDDNKFLLGLDFLQHFHVFLGDGLLVMLDS